MHARRLGRRRLRYDFRVFVLYAVVIGLVLGRVLGGRLDGLASLSFRWPWVAVAGLTVQVGLFAVPSGAVLDQVGPAMYVASTGAVLVFVVANARLRGMPIVALGAALNLVAIVANGGMMPASASALSAAGLEPSSGFTNSNVVASPALAPLGDVFAIPAWMPLANVFSVGDVLVALGIAVVIARGMRLPARQG